MIELDEVQQLRDEALIERLSLSVRNDRRTAVQLLVEMGEVQARGLYRELGFSSLFDYATRKLGMSESEAGLRIRAAKVGRAFPEALEMLARCEVNLTTLSLLMPVLNHDSLHLLHAARGKSKQEVQALIAAHAPKPDVPDSVRRLPPPRPPRARARAQQSVTATPGPLEARDVHACTNRTEAMLDGTREPQALEGTMQLGAVAGGGVEAVTAMSALPLIQPPPKAAAVVQLSAERHRISFTASRRVRELLHEAQDLRRHRYPGCELEALFERALELLVADEKKRRFGATDRPRRSSGKRATTRSRHIPHEVRRQALARSEGRCGFVAADGQRCEARTLLEFHHVVPFARGGASDGDNVVLLCKAHNTLRAEQDYGRAFIRECIEERSSGDGA